ncbi:hypothetical protein NQ317_011072 [Molorchus minor]|uniref:Carbohydrate kinase FGGY C-terminal domain-containing protein n=1 Tax=Molorchus minor TaxID=1323400 RepID=A0ABQ9J3B4_9CUCU|nr:hypothetical protein NQ317_011072 [Molorchus minor]
MADQSAAMFGSCCFYENNIKITMGTGAFLDVNTYDLIHPSLNGMYPLVGWSINGSMIYLSEVPCSDAGSLVEWMMSIGLVDNPNQTSEMAYAVSDSDGVYFIPAFSGLGPPINDEKAATGFVGIKPTTNKEHMVRAVFGKINGGVAKNDFICHMLADLTNLVVERQTSEMSVLGVTFLAGLSCGNKILQLLESMWKDKDELDSYHKIDDIFKPSITEDYSEKIRRQLDKWMEAVERFKAWYKEA